MRERGLTVLDVLESEGLQENALTVGDHLKARINELATRHPIIGTVHGSGLYMGVELVRDRVAWNPPSPRPRPSASGCANSA